MWSNVFSATQFGRLVARARRERGYTQQQFADALAVNRETLSKLENGHVVSSALVFAAAGRLGFRLVVVPKTADVRVTEHD